MMTPEQVSRLLDQVMVDRARSVVDVSELLDLVYELRTSLRDCGLAEADAASTARQLVREAIPRLVDDTFALFLDTTSRSSSEAGQLGTNAAAASPGTVGGGAS
jgi:hypothetical protein